MRTKPTSAIGPHHSPADTRERLLDAAETLFAGRGYAGTSVRDITALAGSNLAAINYHFGSKHNLYRETLVRRLTAIRRQRLEAIEGATLAGSEPGRLEDVLRAFARAFLAPVREAPPEERPIRLLLREMVDPQLPPDLFEDELATPVHRALTEAVAQAAPALDAETAGLCAQSFLGQLVHLLHSRRFTLNHGSPDSRAPSLDGSIDHVVRFTLAALDRFQEVHR